MKVGIYYPFEPYIGGGERYTLAIAERLSRSHAVQLLLPGRARVPSLAAALGYDISKVELLPRTGYISNLEKAVGSSRYDLFICISNHAVPPVASLGRRGIVVVQFPFTLRREDWVKTRLLGPAMLRSYDLAVVYSRFVAEWLRKRAPAHIRTAILPPPVDMLPACSYSPRDPVILGVGRFFEGRHNKRHPALVTAFRRLVDGGLSGWELHLAGATRPEREHQAYLSRVRALAEGYPITVHADISQKALVALYRRASLFWHATGYGTDPQEQPEAMEHFGIVTVEAMAGGCVPVVGAWGGQPEIVTHRVNGFLWRTLDELVGSTLEYLHMSEPAQRSLRAGAIEAAGQYSLSAFHARLDRVVSGLTSQEQTPSVQHRAGPAIVEAGSSPAGHEHMPLVCAVVLNWNSLDLTLDTLASLRRQSYPHLRTIVLDNGSWNQREALGVIEATFPEARTTASRRNLGFAGGCNAGMRVALEMGADYLLLLNNDVLLDPKAIAELTAALEADAEAGAAGPLIFFASEPQRIWFAGGAMQSGGRFLSRHKGLGRRLSTYPDLPPQETGWLAGTALLVKRSAVERVGMMDPAYFLYWEDVDWCYRLRRAGYRLLLVPRARIWHKVNATTSTLPSMGSVYYWERNRLRFIEKWGDLPSRASAWGKILWRTAAWRLRLPKDDPQAETKLEAYRDYLLRRFGMRGQSTR